MTDDQTTTGRCGWVLLAFVFLFLYGILPSSFMGGIAGLKAIGAELGQHAGPDLVKRMFVLAGMIVSFLVFAIIIMFLTFVLNKIAVSQIKRFTGSGKAVEKMSIER
jgi:F0F1-type ATP synthase membrane subunit c/vacuolar-type H+-ATPase subunit K